LLLACKLTTPEIDGSIALPDQTHLSVSAYCTNRLFFLTCISSSIPTIDFFRVRPSSRQEMTKIVWALYDDPINGNPKSYALDAIPKIKLSRWSIRNEHPVVESHG
jgi:hypothetical protein